MGELNFKNIYTEINRKKYYLLSIIVCALILGLIFSYKLIVPKYKSSITFVTDANSEVTINSKLVSTYNEIIKSKTLLRDVIQNLNLSISEEELINSISAERVGKTEVVKITVISDSPEDASRIVAEITKIFSNKIKTIYDFKNVYVIDDAVIEQNPYNVNHLRDITLSIVAGVLLSIIIIVVSIKTDTTVKSVEDLENEVGLKNINVIPIKKKKEKLKIKNEIIESEIINYDDSKSITTDAFKRLKTNIQFCSINNKENKIILVTSCFSSEGKSFVSANLAAAFAGAGKKVVLIDTDMRNGRQAKIFNLPNELGLSNYLSNIDRNGMEINERVNRYINETEIKNLNVITSGNVPPNPSELLTLDKFPELIKELGVFYDLIIFDGAPVLPTTDSLVLARIASSTVLVSLYNKTKKDELLKAKKDIQNVDGRIVGTVLNRVPSADYEFNSKVYGLGIQSGEHNFFKKYEIRKKIKKENLENKKNEFKGLNFDRERKVKQRSYKLLLLKNKIKEFFNKFKKEETKLLDMSKTEKEDYIRNQKRERQEQIRKEKQLKKQERKKQNELNNNSNNSNISNDNINVIENKEKDTKIDDTNNTSQNIVPENNIKDQNIEEDKQIEIEEVLEVNLNNQIKRIEDEINARTVNVSDNNENNENNSETEKVSFKENLLQGIEKLKKSFNEGKLELIDLKNKLVEEYKAKRQEIEKQKEEEKLEKDAYNERKMQDKIEQDTIKKEEALKQEELKNIEREERNKKKEEEKKLRDAERELKKKIKEDEKRELAQKRLIQKGLREAERENKKKQKEALKMKQREETRIKEEILEDNLYPKTKYNKDI